MNINFKYDVFISHSSKDKPIIRELAQKLKDDGISVWLDEWIIKFGDLISLKVEEGLEDSRILLFAMSVNSLGSEWVTLERHTAIFRDPTNINRRFIPLLIDDVELKDTLKQYLHMDWRNKSEEEYKKLLIDCKNIVEKTETPPELENIEINNETIGPFIEIERQIIKLEAEQEIERSKEKDIQINALNKEKDILKKQLLIKDKIIAKQKILKTELETLLNKESNKDDLKKEALVAIEQRDYNNADNLLQQSTWQRNERVADDYYQIALLKELKFEFVEALKNFRLAADINPSNPNYLYKTGELLKVFGLFEESLTYLNLAIPLIKNGKPIEIVKYYNLIGMVFLDNGDLDNAFLYLNNALNINIDLKGEEDIEVAAIFNNLGLFFLASGLYTEALINFEKALKTIRLHLPEESVEIAIILNNMATTLQKKGHLIDAISLLEKSLNIAIKIYGNNSHHVGTRFNNLGLILKENGNYDKAIEYLEKAINIATITFGENNLRLGASYNNLGDTYSKKEEYDKAIYYIDKSLAIGLKMFGEKNTSIAMRYNNLGIAWLGKGENEKALFYFEKALNIDLAIFGENHPNIADRYSNLSMIWRKKEDIATALKYIEMAIKIDIEYFGVNHHSVAHDYNILASLYLIKPELEKAKYYFNQSYKIYLFIYGPLHPETINSKKNYDKY